MNDNDDDDIVMSMYVVTRIVTGGAPGFAVHRVDIARGEKQPLLGPLVGTATTIGVARSFVPRDADTCLMASPADHVSVVETWM